jgi:hypothetical protein
MPEAHLSAYLPRGQMTGPKRLRAATLHERAEAAREYAVFPDGVSPPDEWQEHWHKLVEIYSGTGHRPWQHGVRTLQSDGLRTPSAWRMPVWWFCFISPGLARVAVDPAAISVHASPSLVVCRICIRRSGQTCTPIRRGPPSPHDYGLLSCT